MTAGPRALPVWKQLAHCELCATSFGVFSWRHHCRVCGASLCSTCANKEIAVPFCSDVVRVCRPCKKRENATTMAPLQCDPPLLSDADFKHWQDVLGQRELMNPLQSELNRLVREGVPRGLRATVWPVLLRASKSQGFVACVQSAHCEELIEHDLPRTFPTREAMQSAAFRQLLRDTLRQLHIPYQQGVSLVAATLLSHVARDDAVRCLYALLSNSTFGLSSIFAPDSGGAAADAMPPQWLASFQRVFGTLLPGVYACLGAQGVDASMVVCKWLRTAFAEVLPEPVLLRVWDCYFLHGLDFLFRVAVAMFALVEPEISAAATADGGGAMQLLRLLGDLPAHALARINSPTDLIEQSFALG